MAGVVGKSCCVCPTVRLQSPAAFRLAWPQESVLSGFRDLSKALLPTVLPCAWSGTLLTPTQSLASCRLTHIRANPQVLSRTVLCLDRPEYGTVSLQLGGMCVEAQQAVAAVTIQVGRGQGR